MWRAEVLVHTLYRSVVSNFESQMKELIDTPECRHALHIMQEYLQKFVNVMVPDVRCDTRLDSLYTSLTDPSVRACLQKLPLDWQIVLITHLQTSCAFNSEKGTRGSPDVEYVLPSTRRLVQDFFSHSYWKEILGLCVQYAYGAKLPTVDDTLRKADPIKGFEAVLRKMNPHHPAIIGKRDREDDDLNERDRICLMRNLKPVIASDVPTLTLSEPLRVFSDQHLPGSITSQSPQLILKNLIDSVDIFDMWWNCGYIGKTAR